MTPTPRTTWKYFTLVSSVFVAVLLISNTVGTKVFSVFGLDLPGGVIVFPIAYIFGDILTEVYGYRASRSIIWTGLACNLLMVAVYLIVEELPPAAFWPNQEAFEVTLGFVPRIVAASMVAYFLGEIANAYVMAKMKVLTEGRHLWARTIGSTAVGQGIDTLAFCAVAFIGVFPTEAILSIIVSNYVFKVGYEALATPLTYVVVARLKRAEGVDVYDRDTNFNPFLIENPGAVEQAAGS